METPEVRYLLDTAPWINGLTLPGVLPPRIRRLVGNVEMKGLCSVSLLETAILHRLGRLKFEGALEHLFAVGLSEDLQLLELTPAIRDRGVFVNLRYLLGSSGMTFRCCGRSFQKRLPILPCIPLPAKR